MGELVQKHVAANPRIRYVKIENKGIAANTNAAARLAQGEYPVSYTHLDVYKRQPLQHPVLSALLAWHLPHLARRIGT